MQQIKKNLIVRMVKNNRAARAVRILEQFRAHLICDNMKLPYLHTVTLSEFHPSVDTCTLVHSCSVRRQDCVECDHKISGQSPNIRKCAKVYFQMTFS